MASGSGRRVGAAWDSSAHTCEAGSIVAASDRGGDGREIESLVSAETMSSDGGPRLPPVEARAGDVLAGRYELLGELGRGAFGVVFRARDRVADAVVAIKMLASSRRFSTTAVARLRREVQTAWRVTHPGVVRIYDLIPFGDHLALSMELVDGETLDRRIQRGGRFEIGELLALAVDLARALAAAHEAGVTHRDLKPSNIMLRAGSGRAVITDFGLSRLPGAADDGEGGSDEANQEPALTRSGELLGTPTYMAPEQLQKSRGAGPASDVYAFGLVLFEAATGQRTHPQPTLAELMAARLERPAPSVASLRPELSPELSRLIADCLAIDPAQRIGDAVALLDRLEPLAPSVDRSGIIRRAPPPPRRRRLLPWLAAAMVLLAVGAGAATLGRWTSGRLPAHDRRVAFVAGGNAEPSSEPIGEPMSEIDRALAQLAQRRFAASDHRVATVEANAANVTVTLRWQHRGDDVVVAAELGPTGGRTKPLPPERAGSLADALTPLLSRIAAIVDEGQPERLDAAEHDAMARVGARDVAAYRDYQSVVDEFLGTPLIDALALGRRLESIIARDPKWGHPYAALMHVNGIHSQAARAARDRGRQHMDATRDPIAVAMLGLESGLVRDKIAELSAELDRAFTAAPDDMLLGWTFTQVLSMQRRQQEFAAVLRAMHRRRPDLQFGSDLQQALRTMGQASEIPALQAAWMRNAPANETAWTSQLLVDLSQGRADEATRRARDILLLFGRSPQRLSTLLELLEQRGRLDEASSVAGELLRGGPLERALGWFAQGQIAMLQGRFSAAREAWRSSAREGNAFGSQGPREQSLEEQVAIDAVLGDDEDLVDVSTQLIAEYRTVGNDAMFGADEITRAGHTRPRRCPDVAKRVRAVEPGLGHASYERELWRAAADVGCARCSDVVRLGLAPDERRVRSIFQLGVCAESEGKLELARDAFARVRPLRTMTLSTSEAPATAYSVLASYQLGRVLSRLGRPVEARAAYAEFMSRWGHTDRPIAQVDDARRALAALDRAP
jgi:tetratricopeptide (TPR) repeat protein